MLRLQQANALIPSFPSACPCQEYPIAQLIGAAGRRCSKPQPCRLPGGLHFNLTCPCDALLFVCAPGRGLWFAQLSKSLHFRCNPPFLLQSCAVTHIPLLLSQDCCGRVSLLLLPLLLLLQNCCAAPPLLAPSPCRGLFSSVRVWVAGHCSCGLLLFFSCTCTALPGHVCKKLRSTKNKQARYTLPQARLWLASALQRGREKSMKSRSG